MHDIPTRRLALSALSALSLLPAGALAQQPAAADDRSPAERANLDLLQRFHERVWVRKESAAVPEFMSDDFLSHANPPDAPRGPQPVRQFMETLYAAFPDLRSEPVAQLVDGAHVIAAWTLTGTQRGPLFGAPPSGRSFRVSGVDLMRVRGGRFVEHWFGLGPLFPQILQQIAPASPPR